MRPLDSIRRLIARTLLLAAASPIAFADETPPPAATGSARIDFDRNVRPILAAHCYACHGDKRQESDYRLDRRDAGLAGGANGPAIVPGKSGDSPLLTRVLSADPDQRMPPKGERLTDQQVATLRSWIDQGAVWPADPVAAAPQADHWSLRPLVRPAIPSVGDSANANATIRNPIDCFVRARLAAEKLSASAEADRATLIRRVTLDLTGLPPTPSEVATFLADERPDAYERLVDRLLASPRYGERWARHWMDVAHFAETHGNDQDRPRENAWPYRDYLIRSFNQDKPYRRFVAEQVAGDVLYPQDPQATVALGFLAAGPWDESSLMCIVDDTVDKKQAQLLDRDDMVTNVMSTFTSSTVHCARCHNHKFDPISQADYYSLQAVFAGVDRADHAFDLDPGVHRRRRELAERRQQLQSLTPETLLADAQAQADMAKAEEELQQRRATWNVIVPAVVAVSEGSTYQQNSDGSLLLSGTTPDKDTYTLTLDAGLTGVTAVRLEVLADESLPQHGPGRCENGNLHLSECKLSLADPAGGANTPLTVASAFADFNQDGWSIEAAIDGRPETAWGIHPQEGKDHSAVFVLAQPLAAHSGQRLVVALEQLHGRKHLIGRLRISVTTAPDPALARPIPAEVAQILSVPAAERSVEQRATFARTLLVWQVDHELASLPPPQVVFAACHDFKGKNNFHPAEKPRSVHVLRRGDINQPLEEAPPGGLSCIEGLESRFAVDPASDESGRRAALARWLTSSENVLAWRSIVNRVWHYHFDRGLVDTPNDLGKMGGVPSHPELLDWLAVEFRDGSGSLKELHRLIVTSATYRQSSANDDAASRVDGENRLLWRMNSRRLDAECIRDAVLAASGKLDLAMGGPSVRQFIESKGIHVTPNIDYLAYDVDAPGNFRRSVYRFLFRTLPDPLMESLDCPDGSQLAPVRSASVTALQALALLDDRFVVRQSELMAANLVAESAELPAQIRALFVRTLLREPTADELAQWQTYAQRHGLANACRMMFNTNEFVFVH